MKLTVVFIFIIFQFNLLYAQDNKWIDGKGFESVFQGLDSGEFTGTINGILNIEKSNGQKMILDFQGSNAILDIIKDSNEVYDISKKSYIGKTTSGETEITYQTYALANKIGVFFQNQWFELSGIDGGCDMVINGLDYSYHVESLYEYLVLFVTKELELSNWQYLIRTEHTMKPNNIDELKTRKKTMKILPNSTLVFAIKRNK